MEVAPLRRIIGDWKAFLGEPAAELVRSRLQRSERTGRPLGSDRFLARLEAKTDRPRRPRQPGGKPQRADK